MLRLRGQSFNRPLTHDLLDSVLRRLGGRITSVRVDSLKDDVFHATIVLVHAGRRSELDARASTRSRWRSVTGCRLRPC